MNPIKKRGIVVPIILFCIVLVGIFLLLFQSKEKKGLHTTRYELASTIRLMKIEGEVLIQNAVGNIISTNSQMKLYNGYQITTAKESYAWITLDDTKVVKINENSVVEVQKKKKKITLYVDSGNLFFNVKQPLKTKESFHVKTSTMTMGIRGTSGIVTALKNGESEIRLFTGKVYVYVEEAVNAKNTTKFLMPGNILECTAFDQEKKAKTKLLALKEEDIPNFAAAEIAKDNQLRNRIEEETNLNLSSLIVQDISSSEQMEEDSTKQNQEKSEAIVAKEENQIQETEATITDDWNVENKNTEEMTLAHSSSQEEIAVDKNPIKESPPNTENHQKEDTNQGQKNSQQKKHPAKEDTKLSFEKQPEEEKPSVPENRPEEEKPSEHEQQQEEGTTSAQEEQEEDEKTSAPEHQLEKDTTSDSKQQSEENTTVDSEQQQPEAGSTTFPSTQPSKEEETSSQTAENNAHENTSEGSTMEENTSSTIEESTEEITSPPNTSTDNVEENPLDEAPENSNRPSWWEEIWGEIWDTIKDNLFPNNKI